jgi:hypothetical protein
MDRERGQQSDLEAPPALLAIIQAARAIGDKALERAAKHELADQYGIKVSFLRGERAEVAHAQ